jgi:hypothetical protein
MDIIKYVDAFDPPSLDMASVDIDNVTYLI